MRKKRKGHTTGGVRKGRTEKQALAVRTKVVDLPPPSFEEACAVVADLFEAIPECWARGCFARDDFGERTHAASPAASSWCVIGALHAFGAPKLSSPTLKLRPFAQKLKYSAVSVANDLGGRLVAIKMLRMAAGQIK